MEPSTGPTADEQLTLGLATPQLLAGGRLCPLALHGHTRVPSRHET